MSTDDDGDPNYSPTPLVKFLHSCDGGLEFDIKHTSYVIHVAVIPAVVLLVFFLCALATIFYWFCAVQCCGVGLTNKTVVAARGDNNTQVEDADPEVETLAVGGENAHPEENLLREETARNLDETPSFRPEWERRGWSSPILLLLVLLSGLALGSMLRESGALVDLNQGVHHTASKLGFLDSFVGNLTHSVQGLVTEAEELRDDVAASMVSCTNYTGQVLVSAEELAQQLSADAASIESTLGDFLPDLGRWKRLLKEYGITYRNEVLAFIACLVGAAAAAVLVTAILLRCRFLECGQLLASATLPGVATVVIVVSACAAVTMTTAFAAGDFCMKPTANVLSVVPTSSSNVASFYLTCSGSNPAESSLNSAVSSIALLVNETAALQQSLCATPNATSEEDDFVSSTTNGRLASSCCSHALPAVATRLRNTTAAMTAVDSAASCAPFMDAWQDLVDSDKAGYDDSLPNGLCGGTVEGLVRLWAALFGSALFMALYLALSPRAFAHMVADARQAKEQQAYEAGVRHLQEEGRHHLESQFRPSSSCVGVDMGRGGEDRRRSASSSGDVSNPITGVGGGDNSQPLLPDRNEAEYEDDVFFFGEDSTRESAPGAGDPRSGQEVSRNQDGLAEFFAPDPHRQERQDAESSEGQREASPLLASAVVVGVLKGASTEAAAAGPKSSVENGEKGGRSALL